jgi:hypothetical protein
MFRGVFDYIVRFKDAAGDERTLRYRTHAQLREGVGIAPGSEWEGPLVLVTEVAQDASSGCVGAVRAEPISHERIERRTGRDRRSGAERRHASTLVTVERRSGNERRTRERRMRSSAP